MREEEGEEITVVVSLRDENTKQQHESRERKRRRESRRESGTKQRSKKIRAEKRTGRPFSPSLSLSLCVCFLKLSPAHAEKGEQKRRNREEEEEEEEEEGNAREEGGVRRPPSSFALSAFWAFERVCLLCVLYLSVVGSSPPQGTKIEKKLENQKKFFATIASKPNGAQKREKERKERVSL